jgi:hypothetical protein
MRRQSSIGKEAIETELKNMDQVVSILHIDLTSKNNDKNLRRLFQQQEISLNTLMNDSVSNA